MLTPLVIVVGGLLLLLLASVLQRRALRWLGVGAVLLGLGGTTPLVGNVLVGAIERGAGPPGAACAGAEAVVLLSGGLARPPRDDEDFAALTPRTLERVAGLMARAGWRDRPLIVAGGGQFPLPESRVIAALMRRLGPMPADVLLEQTSLTTWENAQQVRALRPGLRRIALASSALHLPRARIAFEAAGFQVCEWPVHYEALPLHGPWVLWPGSSATRKTEGALHEWVGGFYYRWKAARARSDSTSS